MKVLYNILNPEGLGADRWIYDGYKYAFAKEGHDFYTLTERDDFHEVVERVRPDFFYLDFLALMEYSRRTKNVSPEDLEKLRSSGTKIFCATTIGMDKEQDTPDMIEIFRKYLSPRDVYFCNYAPEISGVFEKIYGQKMHFIPHAADLNCYFPEQPIDRLKCDIAFIGSRYTQKGPQFQEMFMPLLKKYHVRVYGPGWTLKSRALRAIGGAARRYKVRWLQNFAAAHNIDIVDDDKRKLFASAKICVNIHEYYHDGTTKGFSNEREFKVPASNGFQISDSIPGMERYFELGREIVVVKSKEEWFEKIDYYLKHEDERKKIQEAGTARVLREHTYSHRVKQLVELYNTSA